jgi:cyanophycinase
VPTSLSAVPSGTLMAIGGAEDKLGRLRVLRRFVELAGGSRARIALCATASAIPDQVTELYTTVLGDLGAEVVPLTPTSRAAAGDPDLARRIGDVSAVFLSGGNQIKLAQVLTGTLLGDTIVNAHRAGLVVGGTSAGASVMSEHMVAFGSGGATPKHRSAQLARGLGLLPGAVVDQHFGQRNRYGRLLSLVAHSPSLLGVGIDEDTAAIVRGGRVLEVVGRGCVFVVDAGQATTNAASASRTEPLLVSGAVVHTLPEGSHFDLEDRRLLEQRPTTHPAEAHDLTAAAVEAREVARRHTRHDARE